MNFKEFYIIITNDRISTKKKLMAYCNYFREHPGDMNLKSEIDDMFPKFKMYTDKFKKILILSDKVGSFTYNVKRLDYLLELSTSRNYGNFLSYVNYIAVTYLYDEMVVTKGILDTTFNYIQNYNPKFTLVPSDINIVESRHGLDWEDEYSFYLDENYVFHERKRYITPF